MTPDEIRDMTSAELEEKEFEIHKQLFNLRFQRKTGQLENPEKIRGIRRDLARVKTERTQRERQEANEDKREQDA